MADRFIEIKVENEDRVIASLVARGERENAKLRRLIDDLADFTEHYLYSAVPRGTSKYILEHIGREGPTWMPGGAGGGGMWKAIVGIKEGESRHPYYVEFGTGIYGDKGDLIWAASGPGFLTGKVGKVMAFDKGTEPTRFRYYIKGQPPQHYFRSTWRVLDAYARARVFGETLF